MAVGALLAEARNGALDHPFLMIFYASIILPLVYFVINEFIRHSARIKKLPGPTGLPLLGNLWQIRVNAAEQYRAWAKTHGDVYQIQLGNIPIVVVNSAASAKVIFGQYSQALASRPEFYTFHKVKAPLQGPETLTWN
jgi:3-hydroxyphenylacetate 6-hydroxylase